MVNYLNSLILTGNPEITNAPIRNQALIAGLLRALAFNRYFRVLALRKTKIDESAASGLAEMMRYNQILSTLILEGSDLTPSVVTQMAKGLAANPRSSLIYLGILL